jgi:ABC-type transport system substrate-binding protein
VVGGNARDESGADPGRSARPPRKKPRAPPAPRRASGPRAEPVDYFHPDRDTPVEPAYGGTLRLHLENLPRSLNAALENAQAAKNLLFELHATLLRRDWETWGVRARARAGLGAADTLVLGAAGTDGERTLYGTVREDGDAYELVPLDAVPGARRERYTRATVARVERQTVVTFHLREGVRWQDGHPFDADGRDLLLAHRARTPP